MIRDLQPCFRMSAARERPVEHLERPV
jgi:hypothetical protein